MKEWAQPTLKSAGVRQVLWIPCYKTTEAFTGDDGRTVSQDHAARCRARLNSGCGGSWSLAWTKKASWYDANAGSPRTNNERRSRRVGVLRETTKGCFRRAKPQLDGRRVGVCSTDFRSPQRPLSSLSACYRCVCTLVCTTYTQVLIPAITCSRGP